MGETVNELRAHGHRDESLRLASRTLDWYQKRLDVAPSLANREGLGWALYLARRWGEARAVFVELASAKPAELDYFGYIGEIDARAGDAAAARAISERLKTVGVTARDMAFATFQRAIIAAALGEPDEAIDLLRDSFNQGFPYGLALHNDPAFETLRQLPAYQQLVAPVN